MSSVLRTSFYDETSTVRDESWTVPEPNGRLEQKTGEVGTTWTFRVSTETSPIKETDPTELERKNKVTLGG